MIVERKVREYKEVGQCEGVLGWSSRLQPKGGFILLGMHFTYCCCRFTFRFCYLIFGDSLLNYAFALLHSFVLLMAVVV